MGHWERDTLVIDTTNFTDKTPLRGSDDALHVIERLTVDSPDVIRILSGARAEEKRQDDR